MMIRRCLGLKSKCLGDLAKTWPLDWNSIVIMKTHPTFRILTSTTVTNTAHSEFYVFLPAGLRIQKS